VWSSPTKAVDGKLVVNVETEQIEDDWICLTPRYPG
jgi:hypothetical protein